MENLIIVGQKDTYFTPDVKLDAESGICAISGESYLEDTVEFYKPIFDWLSEYLRSGRPITFNFNLTYFNTNSSRSILNILKLLKTYENQGGEVSVNWFYQEGDDDMLAEIEEYMIDAEIDLNLVAYD